MVAFLVPARGDGPSGGDVYDAAVVQEWRRAGRPVQVVAVPGAWPDPAPGHRRAVARALAGHDTAVVDGLVGSACPDEVEEAVAAGRRVVLLVHLPLPAETGLDPGRARHLAALERRALTAASQVVVTSHWSASELRRRYAVRHPSVAVPGAAPGPLSRGSVPAHLLVLGALTPVKNHLTALRALEQVADLAWTAAFVGPPAPDADHAARLAAWIARSPVADRVELPGVLVGEPLERHWQRTDLLLVPSVVETYGLVVTEALAHGIPCLVAARTGAVEALAGGPAQPPPDPAGMAGAALDPGDPAAWAAALRAWATDPQRRDRWRRAAAGRRERLRSWGATAEDVWAAVSGGR